MSGLGAQALFGAYQRSAKPTAHRTSGRVCAQHRFWYITDCTLSVYSGSQQTPGLLVLGKPARRNLTSYWALELYSQAPCTCLHSYLASYRATDHGLGHFPVFESQDSASVHQSRQSAPQLGWRIPFPRSPSGSQDLPQNWSHETRVQLILSAIKGI